MRKSKAENGWTLRMKMLSVARHDSQNVIVSVFKFKADSTDKHYRETAEWQMLQV